MPKLLVLIFFCFSWGVAAAQDYIGDNRQKVRKNFEKYLRSIGATDPLIETDSSLVLNIRNPKFKPVEFAFLFDRQDECIAEIRTGCDTCVANYMNYALDKKFHQWKQTGANQFLSNSRFRLLMELLPGENGSKLIIRKLQLNRRDYLKLLKQQKD